MPIDYSNIRSLKKLFVYFHLEYSFSPTSDTMSDLDWHENVNNNLNAWVHTHMSTSYIMHT